MRDVCGLRTASVLALGLAVAAISLAQGMYYKEIEKDGRIYVFNDAKKAELFEKGGDMGTSITRPGAGPNGETVVADSEHALELFFFKHGISEPVERPQPPTQRVEWRDGKTRITTDNAYLEMSNRIQVRYTHELPPDSIQLPGTSGPGESKGSFRIRRAKFKLEGWIYKPWMTYELQMNWPAVTGSNIGAFLEDANIDFDLTKGKNALRVRFGQLKVPYGRQEMTSSGNQQFVDRSLVSNVFFRGRDTGLAVWGQQKNKIEWRVGVFNGNGLTRTLNDNDKFQYNARVMWQALGRENLSQRPWIGGALYSESDFESTDTPILAIAGELEKNDFTGATTGNDYKDLVGGIDVIYKYKGVFATTEILFRDRTPEIGESFGSNGWYVQGGYLFARRKWEVALRYGSWEPADLALLPLGELTETRGAFSYYYNRHNLKFQSDFGRIKDPTANSGRGASSYEFRFQTQFIF